MDEVSGSAALAGHPELGDERLHLGATLEAIGRAVERPLKKDTGTGDFAALLYMESYRAWRRIQLREALDSPYFARLDFVPASSADGRPETYYIGKTYFEGEGVAVTGWQAPVASLFYRSSGTQASYIAPDGEQHATLRLKRRLVIDHGVLRLIADDLDERPLADRAPKAALPDTPAALLRAVLDEGASPWLRDIIATIQPDQYELIAAPPDQALIVQGVAGSGKTSIALHRLSYLVYPALMSTAIPPRCIVFGPNQLFLKYVSAVLPKLGLQHVVQTTVADWALERMGLERLRRSDTTFEALLSPRVPAAEKDLLIQRSRLKTSRRMGRLLERYVQWRRRQIEIPPAGWTVKQTVQRLSGSLELQRTLSAATLTAAHRSYADRPLAVHRAQFVEQLVAALNAELHPATSEDDAAQLALGQKRLQQAQELRDQAQALQRKTAGAPSRAPAFGAAPAFGPSGRLGPGTGAAPGGDALLRQQIRQLEQAAARRQQEGEALVRQSEAARGASLPPDVAEQARRDTHATVQRLVDRYWPGIEAFADYYTLIGDAPLLQQLAEGIFSAEEVAALAGMTKARAGSIDLSDLPAIHYLFVISQGPEEVGRQVHDYVVVDEAQDVSELDLHCLHLLERRHSFTLLGDLAQSIYGHRGLTSWDQASAVFASTPFRYEECAVSYRTTAEITALANRVLLSISALGDANRTLDPSAAAPGRLPRVAQAFERHGPAPVLSQAADDAALMEQLAKSLAALRERGYASVAIITKTSERARTVAERLEAQGVSDVALVTVSDFDYRGGTVVLPVWLAKGLEFDASIVVDVDDRTYAGAIFDARLLYVALTRAMHALHVLWTGTLSPHLAE